MSIILFISLHHMYRYEMFEVFDVDTVSTESHGSLISTTSAFTLNVPLW
jgi:hypothetical protein